jgi:fructose-1,6-bisphosphatase/inositol monophosphatase family enzyme
MSAQGLGQMNGHAAGIIMKELVRRAIVRIRGERQAFEVTKKEGYGGNMDDVRTSADQKAQASYVRSLQECFPSAGIVAEEYNLDLPSSEGSDLWFTVDPLDGTKAFVRRQSHGVATMIALVCGEHVISAFVGDVNTQEIYGFRPGSEKVHRINEYSIFEHLEPPQAQPLKELYVLLHDPVDLYSYASKTLINSFREIQLIGGSIGTWFAQLWKGEVGAGLLPPSWETPWDLAPIVGISEMLGFWFMRPDAQGTYWKRYTPTIMRQKYKRDHDTLIIHKSLVAQVSP